jgi:hypothetical protein
MFNLGYNHSLFEVGMGIYWWAANAFTVRAEWWAKISDSTLKCEKAEEYGTLRFAWNELYVCKTSGRAKVTTTP